MAQTGYTPILIYSSTTAATAPAVGNLTNSTLGSELAINITDGKLFYKDNANAIQVIGWKTTPTTAGGTGLTSYTAGDLLYYATGTTLAKLAIGTTDYVMTSSGSAPQWSAFLKATAGGTGQTVYAVGDILYASTTTALSKLADVATGNALISGGVGVAPSYGKIGLTTHVSGTLPIANGGTNLTSYTANQILYATATNTLGTNSKLTFDGTTFRLAGATATQTELGYNTATWVLALSQVENNSYQRFKCNIIYASTETVVRVTVSTTPNSGIGWTGSSVGLFVIRRNATGNALSSTIQINNFGSGFRLMTPEISGTEVIFGINTSNNGTGTTISGTVLVECITESPGSGAFDWTAIAAGTAAGGTTYASTLFANNDSILMPGVYNTTVGATNRDVYVDSTGYIGYVSSTRESKTNINSLGNVDWLMDLEPVTFNRKVINQNRDLPSDPLYLNDHYDELEYGLIADDAVNVNKELVFYDQTENGPELRGIHYSKLVTPMLKKIQELTKQVNELKAKIG